MSCGLVCCDDVQVSVAEIYEVENRHICKYPKMSWPKLSPSTPSPPSRAQLTSTMFTRAITAAARQLSRVPRVQSAVTSKACTWQRACVATAGKQVLARSFASSTAPAMYVRCPPVQLCHCNSHRCCMVLASRQAAWSRLHCMQGPRKCRGGAWLDRA